MNRIHVDEGDFRDRLARKFAQEVEKRTDGSLKFDYPAGSLVKSKQQFDAMSRGAPDMSVYLPAYQGGKIFLADITLMPALIAIMRGVMPFIAIMVFSILLLAAFPEIVMWLPGRFFGS
jgi:TRAP-type C4-dicarboxylate transport system substrate-binding protein